MMIGFTDKRKLFVLILFSLTLNIQDAKNAKKRYFSFAVERTAKEKNQSLRDIFRP